jgi:hypothetical protein
VKNDGASKCSANERGKCVRERERERGEKKSRRNVEKKAATNDKQWRKGLEGAEKPAFAAPSLFPIHG